MTPLQKYVVYSTCALVPTLTVGPKAFKVAVRSQKRYFLSSGKGLGPVPAHRERASIFVSMKFVRTWRISCRADPC